MDGHLGRVYLLFLLLGQSVADFTDVPRWGQATAVIADALFVHGGKTNPFNMQSYQQAPPSNDLLYLDLSSPFSGSSPPWQLVSSSSNSSTSQGPTEAWHTLSAFNTSGILTFGGYLGPNTPATELPEQADSAWLINVFDRLAPEWTNEGLGWINEPLRRMHHSAATLPDGRIVIIGGEKTDGSNNGFSDHYVFDINVPSFTLLPSPNGPPNIFGHTSIILTNGLLLVFGGYSQSEAALIEFTTIWVLDTTQSTLSWTTLAVSNSVVPPPRRAFAAVLLENGMILIHGGSDADFVSSFNDGWILDVTQNPAVWTPIPALSQLGYRRDHFAISLGDQVIFGYGYANDSAVPVGIQIYNVTSGTFPPTYIPPPPQPSGTQTTWTLPGPSQTSHPFTGSGTRTGVHPTSTEPNNGGGSSGSDGTQGTNQKQRRVAAVAIGIAFGVLGLVVIGSGAAWYAHKRRRESYGMAMFSALGDDGDGDEQSSPHMEHGIPTIIPIGEKRGTRLAGVLGTLGLAGVVSGQMARGVRSTRERRDILADEDTRDFGVWHSYRGRGRDGSGGSAWSLRSIPALFGARIGMKSREPSTISTLGAIGGMSGPGTPWREKSDPFSDGADLMQDEETGFIGAAVPGTGTAVRPRGGGRESSYTSSRSRTNYIDPFADPSPSEQEHVYRDSGDTDHANELSLLRHPHPPRPPSPIHTNFPLSMDIHTLSPLTEHTSRGSLSLPDPPSSVSTSSHSHDPVISPFESTSRITSQTSFDPLRSPRPPTTSIIGANQPSQPIRRSDTWWARFSRTSFLDRRVSDSSRHSRTGMVEIRDPNPPPRLVAIEESMHSHEQEAHQSGKSGSPHNASISRKGSRLYGGHAKSATSLQTANSEAIERMGGMDVVQWERSASQWTRDSIGSTLTGISIPLAEDEALKTLMTSPVEMTHVDSYPPLVPVKAPSPVHTPSPMQTPSASSSASSLGSGGNRRPTSTGAVASRIQAYERRMSQSQEVPSPTNTKQREERIGKRTIKIDYGLVPRASLFIANPDHGATPSRNS